MLHSSSAWRSCYSVPASARRQRLPGGTSQVPTASGWSRKSLPPLTPRRGRTGAWTLTEQSTFSIPPPVFCGRTTACNSKIATLCTRTSRSFSQVRGFRSRSGSTRSTSFPCPESAPNSTATTIFAHSQRRIPARPPAGWRLQSGAPSGPRDSRPEGPERRRSRIGVGGVFLQTPDRQLRGYEKAAAHSLTTCMNDD
jgi:hypothetical protein